MQTPTGFCQLAWDRVGEPWVPGPWGYIRRVLAAFRGQVGAKRPPVGVSGIRRAGVQWPVCFVWLAKSSSDWQACNDHAKTQAKHLCDIKFFQTQAVARDGPQKETARPCKRQKKEEENGQDLQNSGTCGNLGPSKTLPPENIGLLPNCVSQIDGR